MARLDEDLFERIQASDEDDTVGMRITDRIGSLIAPLEAEHEQLKAEKEAVRSYLARIDRQMTRVDRIIRAARHQVNPTPPANSGKNGSDGGGTTRPSQEKMDAILRHIIEAGRPITNRELMEISGMKNASVNACTHWLRRDGKIRLAGFGGPKNSSNLFLPAVNELEEVAA